MPRRTLIAFFTALVITASFITGLNVTVGSTGNLSHYSESPYYGYKVNIEKMADPDFIAASCDENTVLMLGSSEFAYTSKIPENPMNNWQGHNYGFEYMFVGTTHYQSLWQAIAMGALSDKVEEKNVVFLLSPQWFSAGGIPGNYFTSTYSRKMMEEFLQNPSISDETKAAVSARVESLLTDPTSLQEMLSTSPLDRVEAAIKDKIYNLQVAKAAEDATLKYVEPSLQEYEKYTDAPVAYTEIEWGALFAQAKAEGRAASTNNTFGIYNEFFDHENLKNVEPGSKASDDYSSSNEYDDLRLFLQVCEECGYNVMVVNMPFNGAWYDYTGVSREKRDTYYNNIRSICGDYDVTLEDFAKYEHEKYFFCDTYHPGWRGWLHIEEAVCDFVSESE